MAAAKIQARIRGQQARRRTTLMKEKRRQEIKRLQQEDEDNAATKIQANFRGRNARKSLPATLNGKPLGISRGRLLKIKTIFDQCDADGSGSITKAEFLQCCKSANEFEDFYEDIDGDGDGKISWEEFQEFYAQSRASKNAKTTDDVTYDEEAAEAATKIQARFRGNIARKNEGNKFFEEFDVDVDEDDESF